MLKLKEALWSKNEIALHVSGSEVKRPEKADDDHVKVAGACGTC